MFWTWGQCIHIIFTVYTHPSQQKNRINDGLGSGCSAADTACDTFNKYVAEQEKVEENRDDVLWDVCTDSPVAWHNYNREAHDNNTSQGDFFYGTLH